MNFTFKSPFASKLITNKIVIISIAGVSLFIAYKYILNNKNNDINNSSNVNNVKIDFFEDTKYDDNDDVDDILLYNNKKQNSKDMLPININEYYEVAMKAALHAGRIISHSIRLKNKGMATKSNSADIVTTIDKKCEKVILSYIKKAFPNDIIIAEESFKGTLDTIDDDKVTWCIDPIDGTTNFVHKLPTCAVSIGARYKGKSILGIVHCPLLRETFYGILNHGSYLVRNNNFKIKQRLKTRDYKIKGNEAFNNVVMFVEYGVDRSELFANSMSNRIKNMIYKDQIRAIRMFGSCAIHMCFIADGRAHAYFEGKNKEYGPKIWDYTASEVIVNEAGGHITAANGDTFDPTMGNILCTCNKQMTKLLVDNKYSMY